MMACRFDDAADVFAQVKAFLERFATVGVRHRGGIQALLVIRVAVDSMLQDSSPSSSAWRLLAQAAPCRATGGALSRVGALTAAPASRSRQRPLARKW